MRFIVSGRSMEPTFKDGDRLWVYKYVFRKPQKGDVVVIRHPQDDRLILKRIIAKQDNGYFVKGDNENESTDSRSFGLVKEENIIGRVLFKY